MVLWGQEEIETAALLGVLIGETLLQCFRNQAKNSKIAVSIVISLLVWGGGFLPPLEMALKMFLSGSLVLVVILKSLLSAVQTSSTSF